MDNLDDTVWWKIAGGTGIAFIAFFKRIMDSIRSFYGWLRKPSAMTLIAGSLAEIKTEVKLVRESMSANFDQHNGRLEDLHRLSLINQARFFALGDASETPMYECELPSGDCIWTNEALQQLFNLPFQETLGNGWARAVVADDRKRVFDTWEDTIKHWRPYKCVYRIEPHGKPLSVIATAEVVRDATGKPILARGKVVPVQVCVQEIPIKNTTNL